MPPNQRRRGIPRALLIAGGLVLAVGLVLGGLFVVVRGTGGGSTSCAPDAGGWNGAGRGPAETADVPGALAHDPGPGWKPVWQYPAAGASASDRVAAPPSVAGGSVYTAGGDGTLVALDAGTGALQWTSPPQGSAGGLVETPIALDGCAAAVATSLQGTAGQPKGALRAVDLRTHQQRWSVPTADAIFSAPQIVDGVAYAGLAFAPPGGAPLDRLYVLDGYYLSDGSAAYRKRFSAAVLASIASDHQRIWIGDLDQDLYALGAAGRQLWTYTTGGIVSLPAMYDGSSVVVLSADHHLAALDPGSGREKWTAQVGVVRAAMAEAGGSVVVAEGSGTVRAFSTADGGERWHTDLHAPVSHGVVAAGSRVFVVDDAGTLHVLDAATGRPTASWTAPAPAVGAPAIAGGRLYLTCQDGRLYALPL